MSKDVYKEHLAKSGPKGEGLKWETAVEGEERRGDAGKNVAHWKVQ